MLRQAWNAHRGWAKLARDLESWAQQWNHTAVLCVIAAAVFGALGSVAPNTEGAWIAGAATVASAVGAFLGRQIVGSSAEAEAVQARATAEGIKSECYRYAARSGAYAVPDADAAKVLSAHTADLVKAATDRGLVRGDNPIPDGGADKREPPTPMTKEWYAAGRIQDQIDYYRGAIARNRAAADQLWWVAFAAGLAAIVAGALGVWQQEIAPWIGAATTIAMGITAYSLVNRRNYLNATYAAMQSRLEEILGFEREAPMKRADLVTMTEDLIIGEFRAWLPQMLTMLPEALGPRLRATRAVFN